MGGKVYETEAFAHGADAKRHAVGAAQSNVAPADEGSRAARQKKKSAVLVVGMHRSGTSAVARMLSLLGCDMPKTLMPAGPGNELGHWESLPIRSLNDGILASAGSSWDDWEAFNPAWPDSPVKDAFLEHAVRTLEDEFGTSPLFVLKDPRICRLLPFWIEALEAFGATPRIVCPVRHPMEVAASLERRDGIDPSLGQLLWLRHVLDAEVHSRGLRRVFLRYEALLTGWRSLPDRLGRDLGIAWPRSFSRMAVEIDGFLSPAHRHHAEADATVLDDPSLSCWIRSSFEIFDRWVRGGETDDDWEGLDRIRAALDEAAPAFAQAITAGRQAARRSAALEQELAAAGYRSAALETAVASKEAELTRRDAELAETRDRVGVLETAGAAQEAELTRRDAELAETRDRVGVLETAVAAKNAEFDALQQAAAAREAHIGALKRTVTALRSSTSWRVTAPVRRVVLALKRARYNAAGYPMALGVRALITMSRAPLRDWRAARAIARSELFDRDWYLTTYPDVAALGIDPVRHYVAFGAREGRDPGPRFSTCGYLSANPDIATAGVNALGHYIIFGESEHRRWNQWSTLPRHDRKDPLTPANDAPATAYVSEYQTQQDFAGFSSDVKAIAFHLPQFHACSQNDEWWGDGFTEWTNTRKAEPRFLGHYQPREPHPDIGYYDLSIASTLRKQADLARAHGIYGFCFYHYWFSGKRILERPVNMLLQNKDIDIKFCLCWANENWTRSWDGMDQDILLEQKYLSSDPTKFVDDLYPYLVDDRYICIDNKPIILVYKPQCIPNPGRVFEEWRSHWRKKTGRELLIWCVRTDYLDPDMNGLSSRAHFDAAVEFPPHVVPYYLDPAAFGIRTKGHFFDYRRLVYDITHCQEPVPIPTSRPFYRTVMLGWDNSARRAEGWSIWYGFCIELYYDWLSHIIGYARNNFLPDRRFVFINAWNEWAEGTYVEPDSKYGYASINTTSRALFDLPMRPTPRVLVFKRSDDTWPEAVSIAVHLHMYHEDLLDEFLGYLKNIPYPFHLFVTTDSATKKINLDERLQSLTHLQSIAVSIVPNRGRDVAPFLSVGPELLKFQIIAHLHTKKSETVEWGSRWRRHLLDNLVGSEETVRAALAAFCDNPRLGLLYPAAYPLIAPFADWGGQALRCREVLARLGCEIELPQNPSFPVGSMFWARSAALAPMLQNTLTIEDFEEEAGQLSMTLGHCVERLWRYVAAYKGFEAAEFLSRAPRARSEAPPSRRLVLLVHYDSRDSVSDADVFLARQLAAFSTDLILMTNSDLPAEEMQKLQPICTQIHARDNTGFDFAGWRDAIEMVGWDSVQSYDEIVLVNNSCYGPVFPIQEMFAEMASKQCDFWGVTAFPQTVNSLRAETQHLCGHTIPEHIQSYFMVFKGNVVQSSAFADFWSGVEDTDDFLQVVARYEIGLTECLTRAKFTWDCYVPESLFLQQLHNDNAEYNAVYSDPVALLLLRSPFVKKKAHKYAALQVPALRAMVRAFGYYPDDLMFLE